MKYIFLITIILSLEFQLHSEEKKYENYTPLFRITRLHKFFEKGGSVLWSTENNSGKEKFAELRKNNDCIKKMTDSLMEAIFKSKQNQRTMNQVAAHNKVNHIRFSISINDGLGWMKGKDKPEKIPCCGFDNMDITVVINMDDKKTKKWDRLGERIRLCSEKVDEKRIRKVFMKYQDYFNLQNNEVLKDEIYKFLSPKDEKECSQQPKS